MIRTIAGFVLLAVAAAPLAGQGRPPAGGRPPMEAHHPGSGRPGGPSGPGMGEDPLAHHMYAPELIMQHQGELGLTDAQRTTIAGAMKEAQGTVVDTQWKLSAEVEKLGKLLHEDRIDEPQALTQVDRVLSLEREMKRAQMTLMIRLKNALTPAQQQKLQQLHHPDQE